MTTIKSGIVKFFPTVSIHKTEEKKTVPPTLIVQLYMHLEARIDVKLNPIMHPKPGFSTPKSKNFPTVVVSYTQSLQKSNSPLLSSKPWIVFGALFEFYTTCDFQISQTWSKY